MMPTNEERRQEDLRITSLENLIKEGFARVENSLMQMDTRLRNVENCQAGQMAAQSAKIDNLDASIKTLNDKVRDLEEKEIANLKNFVDRADPWINAVKWLAGAIGLMVTSLLWAIFTHTIELVQH